MIQIITIQTDAKVIVDLTNFEAEPTVYVIKKT